MKRSAILTFFVSYCAFCFSQTLTFSKKFETDKKSVPIAIINSPKNYFHVLRYNKVVHDITIERRAKAQANIIAFTPLKLDSVNAGWFDYEKLDYLFFEQDQQLYFVFEKVLNTKRTIYLKTIDSLTKASGFTEVCSLEKEKAAMDFGFEFKRLTGHSILVIASQIYYNSIKKTAYLFDVKQKKISWIKKLPIENEYTGFSRAFTCDESNNLFYMLVKSTVVSSKRKYINHNQVQVPVFFYDSLFLVSYFNDPPTLRKKFMLANLSHLNDVHITVKDDELWVQTFYALNSTDSNEKPLYFSNSGISKKLSGDFITIKSRLNSNLRDQLTFYDGADSKYAGDKDYDFLNQAATTQNIYQLNERRDQHYYKELIIWGTDSKNNQITGQFVIPRKTMVFKGRTRLKNVGEAMFWIYNNHLNVVVLESPQNLNKQASEFNFHKFRKENNLWNSNIVMYTIEPDNQVLKQLIYKNSELDMVPLKYSGNNCSDMIFYMSSGKVEQFATFSQNPS